MHSFYGKWSPLGQKAFIVRVVLAYVAFFAYTFALAFLSSYLTQAGAISAYEVAASRLLQFALLIYMVIQCIRRLRDVGKSDHLALLTFIPYFNIVFFLYLAFIRKPLLAQGQLPRG